MDYEFEFYQTAITAPHYRECVFCEDPVLKHESNMRGDETSNGKYFDQVLRSELNYTLWVCGYCTVPHITYWKYKE